MFRFFNDVIEARTVAKRLDNLGVAHVLTIHSTAQEGTDCAYVEVAEQYSHTLNLLAEDLKRGKP